MNPLSGPFAQPGRDVLAAAKGAQDIVNNKHDLDLPLARTEGLPNLGGAKIELVVADHQGKPEIGRGEAERLSSREKGVARCGADHISGSAAASIEIGQRAAVLTFLEQNGDGRIDGDLLRALGDQNLAQHAFVDGFDLHRRLVGLDLGDDVARGDAVALVLQPAGEVSLGHRRRQRGHQYGDRHGSCFLWLRGSC